MGLLSSSLSGKVSHKPGAFMLQGMGCKDRKDPGCPRACTQTHTHSPGADYVHNSDTQSNYHRLNRKMMPN